MVPIGPSRLPGCPPTVGPKFSIGRVTFKWPAGEPWTCPRCLDGQLLWYKTDTTNDMKFFHHRIACNRCGYVEYIIEPREPSEDI
jgi:ribosomal protein S27AE